jgi:hypothetical protein
MVEVSIWSFGTSCAKYYQLGGDLLANDTTKLC